MLPKECPMRSRLGGHTRLVAVRFGLVECSVYFKSKSILTEVDIFVTYIIYKYIILLRYMWRMCVRIEKQ